MVEIDCHYFRRFYPLTSVFSSLPTAILIAMVTLNRDCAISEDGIKMAFIFRAVRGAGGIMNALRMVVR